MPLGNSRTVGRGDLKVRYGPYHHRMILANRPLQPIKIAVIGAGHVGATTAYSLLLSGLAAELVLVDIDRKKAEGEVMDLNHAAPFSHQTRITLGTYSHCAGADVVVLTAGRNQKPGETRLDLIKTNAAIIKSSVPEIVKSAPETILLVAANPVDVLTYVAWKESGFPRSRVIGSGTLLDTARLRYAIGQRLSIDPVNIHADIIGEHGDTELPVWSHSNICGLKLADYCQQTGADCDLSKLKQETFNETKSAAYNIIKLKGVTDYGIASGLVEIVETILRNENTLLTVSTVDTYAGVPNVALSVPVKVNRLGAHPIMHLQLTDEEQSELVRSAKTLRSSIESVGL